MKRRTFLHLLSGTAALPALCSARAAGAEELIIPGETRGAERPVPVSLSGFTGEVATVLRFDLEVMGCEIVGAGAATYQVSGSNSGQVAGELRQVATQSVLLNNRYSGGSLRTQTHALANDVIEKITGRKGIAGTRIAFRAQNGLAWALYVSDFDGANPFKISTKDDLVAAPAWVSGGQSLYYTSYEAGSPDIYFQNLQTGARKVIARYHGTSTSAAPSPDGRRVAMILSKSGNPELYLSDAEGGNLQQLTRSAQVEACPCWSPDGRQICFVTAMPGQPTLNVIPSAGGPAQRLRTPGAGRVTEPDWSPDGRQIIFTVERGNGELAVVPAGGGQVTTLVAGEDASWAANSRTVVFARRNGARSVLSLLDVPTKRTKDVPLNLGSCSQPSWAR